MEKFPESFTFNNLCTLVFDKTSIVGKLQLELLAQQRQMIFDQVVKAKHSPNTVYAVNIKIHQELCSELRKQLAAELLERFPGKIERHVVIKYGDVDTFDKMTVPMASDEYRIILV